MYLINVEKCSNFFDYLYVPNIFAKLFALFFENPDHYVPGHIVYSIYSPKGFLADFFHIEQYPGWRKCDAKICGNENYTQ